MAMLMVESNDEWKQIGGRLILPVHDELIAEVPIENYERGAELLSQMMCEAANFLPFDSKCDVEVSYRWYGMSYPCPYPQPVSLKGLSKEEVKWSDLRGDEALGISGVELPEYQSAILDYMSRYSITEDQFIEHIHTLVHEGVLKSNKLGEDKIENNS